MTYNELKEQFMEDVKRELYERKGMEVEIVTKRLTKSILLMMPLQLPRLRV